MSYACFIHGIGRQKCCDRAETIDLRQINYVYFFKDGQIIQGEKDETLSTMATLKFTIRRTYAYRINENKDVALLDAREIRETRLRRENMRKMYDAFIEAIKKGLSDEEYNREIETLCRLSSETGISLSMIANKLRRNIDLIEEEIRDEILR